MKKILIIDNYDSFTYNLYHLINECGYTDIAIHRNDQISLEEIGIYDKIVLSPGPGVPSEAGILLPLIQRYASEKSILGVCLGHQAIGEAFGAALINLPDVYHGISSEIHLTNEDKILFRNIHKTIKAGRYHSWAINHEDFPDDLIITAKDDNNIIMAIRHRDYDVHGIQFHPESILTPDGKQIIQNFLNQ
ncbi:MAG: anthranilate synthase component II [Bacteroidales bacterium]